MDEDRKISFYSDAAHNYMVLECPPGLKENYQYKMLAANRISGLLSCSGRSIDSREYLYYDISSRQSLTDLYDRRPVRGADLNRILKDLVQVEETLTEYLLDTSHLILDPECVYLDFREQSCCFVYYPGEEQQKGPEPLFTFLADRIDGRDKQAAALIYRLCMMAEKPGFRFRAQVLADLGMHVDGESTGLQEHRGQDYGYGHEKERALPAGADRAYDAVFPSYEAEEEWDIAERYPERDGRREGGRGADRFRKQKRGGISNSPEYSGREPEGTDPAEENDRIKESAGRGIRPMIFAGLCAAAGIALLLSDRFLELEESQLLLTRAFGGILTGAGVIALIVCLLRRRKRKAGQETEEEAVYTEPEPWERAAYSAAAPGTGEYYGKQYGAGTGEYYGKQYGAAAEEQYGKRYAPGTGEYYGKQYGPGAGEYYGGSYGPGRRGAEDLPYDPAGPGAALRTSAAPGETCLLGPDTRPAAGLYGTGSCRGEQISLSDLPCVVGKMRDYVDQVLDDSSVSRMHARFSRDREGKMTVRDLNSTNGTWLNGERLQPNESRVLQQGDHLRLGRMEFVFR